MIARRLVVAFAVVLVAPIALGVVAPRPALAAHAQEGTPALSTPGADAGGLRAMLDLVPDVPLAPEAGDVLSYVNYAAQLAAAGFVPPSTPTDDAVGQWTVATLPLSPAQPRHADSWMFLEEVLGFGPTQVAEAVEFRPEPGAASITLLRGAFDQGAMAAAWEGAGYRPVDVDGGTVYRFGEDSAGAVTPSSTLGDLSRIPALTNAVVLGDGTLVFASSVELAGAVLDVVAGRASSFGARPDVAALLESARPDLAAVVLVNGTAFEQPTADFNAPAAEQEAEGRALEALTAEFGSMPPIALALLGTTPVPQPDQAGSASQIALLFADRDAALAAASIVAGRLPVMRSAVHHVPYTDLVRLDGASVAGAAPVLVLDLHVLAPLPRLVFSLYVGIDLRFLFSGA